MSDSLYAINGDATGGGGGGAPSGPAGGDLGGTYPNPTVTDLTIASEARGDLLRRGASAWERVSAKTAGNVVAGDGTDVVSQPIATTLAVAPAANRAALGAAAAAGAVSLDAANVFTDLQTLSKSSGSWGIPIPVAAFRHNNGGSSWQGVGVRFEVKSNSDAPIAYGYVIARAYGVGGDANNNLVEMRPAHSAGDPPVGLRVRCNVASAIWGVELLLAAAGGSPTFQPCRESGSGDVDLTLQGLGAGVVRLPAATGYVGTVAEINALTRPVGVMAFATNASGGPKPCWSTGSAWVLADGSALS